MKQTATGKFITAEVLREGYLIKNTSDITEAWKALNYAAQVPPQEHDLYEVTGSGLFRKVPGQWSDYNLYEVKPGKSTIGAFPCVIFWRKPNFKKVNS